MRSKTLSKTSHNRISRVENSELEEEPCFSGYFIRSLVRQLSFSRFKEPMDPVSVGAEVSHQLIEDPSKVDRKQRWSQRAQTQPKKQVRRRLHTTKPYQERPINMAEARREIVAALKFHRATMKQASQQQQQNSLMQREFRATSPSSLPIIDSAIGTTTYRLNSLSHKCMSSPFLPAALHPPNFCCSNTSLPPISFLETVNFSLPGRPLGLNLNLHEFTNPDTSFSNNNCPSFPLFTSGATTPTSSSSSSCLSSFTAVTHAEVPSLPVEPFMRSEATSDSSAESLHPVLGEKEMAEIRSIGDQYNMEWNDNLNLVQSSLWNKFIETMDTSSQFQEPRIMDGGEEGTGIFDEVSCFPAWVPDKQLMDNINREEVCLQDACLPCLDIGDIEGIDGEWLL